MPVASQHSINKPKLELFTDTTCTQKSIKMGYEDSVYLAKLAEQAERYEGEYSFSQIPCRH